MKKHIILGLFLGLVVTQVHAGVLDWLDPIFKFSKEVVYYFTDSIEDEIAVALGINSREYREYKRKSDAVQEKIKALSKNEAQAGNIDQLLAELKKEEEALLAEVKTKLSSSEYEKFKKDLNNRQYFISTALKDLKFIDQLAALFKKYVTHTAKMSIDNPYRGQTVLVKQTSAVQPQEENFKRNRVAVVKRGLAKFMNMQSPGAAQPPTLAIVASGGGYRAMILTAGYLKAAEDMGLLDATTYMSTLSGSTWFLAPWIMSDQNVAAFKASLLEKIKNKRFDLKTAASNFDARNVINDIIWPKFVYNQPVSTLDLYGALLANTLLRDYGKGRQRQHLSDQLAKVSSGSKPYPIYTAASMHNVGDEYRYNWYEFTPIEVRNLETDLFIPTYAFNSKFEAGHSVELASEQSMGYLMGIFGSAFSVSLSDMYEAFFKNAQKISAEDKKDVKAEVATKLFTLIEDMKVSKIRIDSARIYNPFLKLPSTFKMKGLEWLQDKEYLSFVDAGLHYNIPIKPLLRPERNVQAILVVDSSATKISGFELTRAFNDINRMYGYSYTRVDAGDNKTLGLYKDLVHPQAPLIVYVTYYKDEKLMQKAEGNAELKKLMDDYKLREFDPEQCLAKEFCSTFNFDYSADNFLQLSAMAEFNLKANKDAIVQFLKNELKAPTVKVPGGVVARPEVSFDDFIY